MMLETDGLVAGYGGRAILSGVDLRLAEGEIVTVIGHNGAGKSTLLKAIFNMVPQRSGTVRFRGAAIDRLRPHEILAAGLAYIPQNHSLFPKLTIAENLAMGGYLLRDTALLRQRVAEVEALFPMLADRRRQLAGSLSGGEQRILEVARTLLMDPALIMLDEPSIGLAPKMVDLVFDTVRLLRDRGKSILMVEQNVKKALAASDRGYVLELGVIKLEDKGPALIGDERVARLYMGQAKGR
jgi:ABC-type branched-subunit amino acid transport system ATPase component